MTKNPAIPYIFINCIILFYLWSILGIEYTPVNDAWVSTYYAEFFQTKENWFQNPRVFRMIPFWIASELSGEGFLTINVFLLTINLLTSVTIYQIINKVFNANAVFSAASALLIMYFPYDGTMFWLGAFGVNLGFLFALLSLYYFVSSVRSDSWFLLVISSLFLLASFRTYPGYIPFLLVITSLFLLFEKERWRRWWTKALVFVSAWLISFVLLLSDITSASSRESKVADFSPLEVLHGFYHAFKHLYWGVLSKLISGVGGLEGLSLILILVVTVFFFYLIRGERELPNTVKLGETFYKNILLHMLWIAPIIVFFGYAPYAVTELRFGVDRQFLFAKFGIAILLVSLIFWLCYKFIKSDKYRPVAILFASTLTIGSSVQFKAGIAEDYSYASKLERIFLGDLAESLPLIRPDVTLLIYFEDDVVLNKQSHMLINRPQYLVSYLYQQPSMQVVATNDYLWNRFTPKIKDESIFYRQHQLNLNNLLVLKYSSGSGFNIMRQLTMPTETNSTIELTTAPDIAKSKVSDRQRWFIEQKNLLRVHD